MSPNGKAPQFISVSDAGSIRLREDQRAFGERSSVLEANFSIRVYPQIKHQSQWRNFITFGVNYLNENVGDLIVLVEDWRNPGSYTPNQWSGEDRSSESFAFFLGAGAEVISIREFPLILEVSFQLPFKENSTPHIPIKAKFRF
jgi:hypothetical protein